MYLIDFEKRTGPVLPFTGQNTQQPFLPFIFMLDKINFVETSKIVFFGSFRTKSIKLFQTFKKWFKVVYNCFFAETGQATTHRRDIILHAVGKLGMWVNGGSFLK